MYKIFLIIICYNPHFQLISSEIFKNKGELKKCGSANLLLGHTKTPPGKQTTHLTQTATLIRNS